MRIGNTFPISINTRVELSVSDKHFILFPTLYKELNDAKNKIDEHTDGWDKTKKITNPYELIHISYCRDTINNSIANYSPLSRSYYKMWEMIMDYKLFENVKEPIVSASLAEGPGGFMEAIYNYRGIKDDKYYGLTLPPTDRYIPGWKKVKGRDYQGFSIKYGDLYNVDDVIRFSENFDDKKAYIVTADGGFDYSSDFNNQEQLSYRIIFSEVITNLKIQKIGGCFVCKVFDILSIFTIKLLYLLYCSYDEIHIVKPRTSRSANSEKYVVAKGYKGIEDNILNNLYDILRNWDETVGDKYVADIVGFQVDNSFIHLIYNYNKQYIINQLNYINKTVEYTKKRPEKEEYRQIIKEQTNNAISWCKKYNIPINRKSRYLNYL